jgi:hypothetical protein
MGFIHDVTLDGDDRLRDGGWVFFTLDATSDFAALHAVDRLCCATATSTASVRPATALTSVPNGDAGAQQVIHLPARHDRRALLDGARGVCHPWRS